MIGFRTYGLTMFYFKRNYSKLLRLIHFEESKASKELVYITNRPDLEPAVACQLYKMRRQMKFFFK